MRDYASYFTRDPSYCHLNAGTRTRTPLAAIEFLERERREDERNPTKAFVTAYNRLWEVQKRLAAFLGCDPRDLFLRLNVTNAFNDFLFALPALEPGELVSTGWEYGGIVGVAKQWARINRQGFREAPLEIRANWTRTALRDAVLATLDGKSRILLVSHVATATGALLPVEEIAAAARERGVITVIDGAHAAGALPLSLGGLEADFYGGNFHKWFLGPEGTGFGWAHPRWRSGLEWKYGGWASEAPPGFYENFGDRDPETCRRLMPGTFSASAFLALGEVLRFWEEHAPEALRAYQNFLRDVAKEEGERAGWKCVTPAGTLSPLVAFHRPSAWTGPSAPLATRLLKEAGVQLALPEAQGVPLVRLSPGVYATEDEVRRGVRAAAEFRP